MMSSDLSGAPGKAASQAQGAASRAVDGQFADETSAKARGIIADVLDCAPAALTPDADLVEDLGADEMALANVATALEMELGIDGLYEEVDYWQTVDDILDSIHEQAS
ncbi:acyl carrier protein [Streptomyces klenkii]|uniref:acyl carrier protein n=1 Tax=Streptomyces klenkii TaxID=1420899 RepID=UPI00344A4468